MERKLHDLSSNISREIIIAVAFVIGLVFLGGGTISSAADTTDQPATVLRTMSLTGEPTGGGAAATLFTRTSEDSFYGHNSQNDNSQYLINFDKYKNLTIHYSVENISSQTQKLEAIFSFPFASNYSLEYDPSRSDQLSLASNQTNPAFTKALTYESDPKTYINFDNWNDKTASLCYLYMGGEPIANYQNMAPHTKVTMSAPIKANPSYDFANPTAGYFTDATYLFTPETGVAANQLQWLDLNYVPFESILLRNDNAVTATNYSALKQAAVDNIQALFKDDAKEDTTTSKASIVTVEPTSTPGTYDITYKYDGITKKITGTTTDKTMISAKDFTVNYGSNWSSEKFNGLTGHTDANGNPVSPLSKDVAVTVQRNGQAVDSVNTNNAGAVYDVTYSLPNDVSETIHVTVGPDTNGGDNGGNGGSGTIIVPSTNGDNSTNTNSSSNSSSNNTTTEPAKPTTNNSSTSKLPAKGTVVYATKSIYLYKNAIFNKNQRLAKYPKAKRVNRPMFVVIGYAHTKNGTLRYKVKDVNHGTKTANKRGYITANKHYVVKVYYSSMPKNKKVTVIAKKGVNAYKNASLTNKAKHYKKSARLTVKKIVKHNLTTRYQLSNGYYITANKKLIIQGNY